MLIGWCVNLSKSYNFEYTYGYLVIDMEKRGRGVIDRWDWSMRAHLC